MGQVSGNWVEVEDTGSVRNAQEETCEWEEEKISLGLLRS